MLLSKGRIVEMIVLEVDQAVLDLRVGHVRAEATARANHAVTRYHDRAGIRFEHFNDIVDGDSEFFREFLVIGELAVRNRLLDILVEFDFLLVAHRVDGEIKRLALAE